MSQATFCKVPPRNFRRLTATYSLGSIGSMTYRTTTLLSAFLKSQQTHTTGTPLSLVPILLASLINSSIALAASLTKTPSLTSHHQAVGAPPEILRAEEERVLKELLLRKECSVCGKPITDSKAVHGALTPSCTHKRSVVIWKEDLRIYFATPNCARGRQSLKFHSMLGAQLQRHSPPSRYPTARKHPRLRSLRRCPPPTGNLRQRVVRRMLH